MDKYQASNDPNSLEYALQVLKKNIFITLNVCLPAIVLKYDSAKNTVDVQPAIQQVMKDNTFLDLPKVFEVPVITLGGNGLSIRIPLKQGDTGIIICADSDISLFVQELANTQPQTLRKHDLADCFFIPSTFNKVGTSNANAIDIQDSEGNVKFQITSSGITIKGDVTIEGDVIADGISLKNHTHKYVKAKSADNLVSETTESQKPTE